MRRAFILSALAILLAFVVALAINVWVTWVYLIPDRPGPGRFLAPGLKFALAWLEDGLAEVPDRDPDALGQALGADVEPLSPERALSLSASPKVSLPLGEERFDLYVDDTDDTRLGVLHTATRGPLLIDGLREMSPFNHATVPVWLGLSLVVGSLASPVILLPLFRRLNRLEETARRLSAGELDARAPLAGPTHTLALALNTMAERTGRVLRSHEELLQAVAHELRTPTARIRFGVELMAGVEDRAERGRRADALDGDLSELDALVSELLSFARLGAENDARPREVIDATALIREVIDERVGGPEVVLIGEPTLVEVEPRAMRRAVRNLVRNAARFAKRRVEVRVEAGERVAVLIDDDGPGVPEVERGRIFAPFAVGEPSRSRTAGLDGGGVGLGLAIVRRIAELHGGAATCEGSSLGGARFVTTWPRPTRKAA